MRFFGWVVHSFLALFVSAFCVSCGYLRLDIFDNNTSGSNNSSSNSSHRHQVSVSPVASTKEGANLQFRISIEQPATEDLVVSYFTRSASSQPGDAPLSTGTAVIPKGSREVIINVATTVQFGYQGNRDLTIVIDAVNAKKEETPVVAVGTIIESSHKPGILKDLNLAPDQVPHYFFNGYVYFAGYSPETGFELWKTNKQETLIVKDIVPGPKSSMLYTNDHSTSPVFQFFEFKGANDPATKLYFIANDTLFKTDGTATGTEPVITDQAILSENSFTGFYLGIVNQKIVFEMINRTSMASRLWATDGTNSGTVLLYSGYHPGSSSSRTKPILFNNNLYFSGNCSQSEFMNKLCKTDGTPAGTSMVLDTSPGIVWSKPSIFIECNGKLFMGTEDWTNQSTTDELYVSDGTTAGTSIVKKIPSIGPSSKASPIACINNKVVFTANSTANGMELWISDGTGLGTSLIKDITPGPAGSTFGAAHGATFERNKNFIVLNDILYFYTNTPNEGTELWRSDGTNIGTYLLKDIYLGENSSWPHNFRKINNKLVFVANDGQHGFELWQSDGTSSGTTLFIDLVDGLEGSSPENILATPGLGGSPNRFFFSAVNQELGGASLGWSDLTYEGTSLTTTQVPTEDSYPNQFTKFANSLLFTADDGTWGNQIWTTDGQEEGTLKFIDLFPNSGCMAVAHFFPTSASEIHYFIGKDAQHGSELWQTDGTPAGTFLIKDINPGKADGVLSFPGESSKMAFGQRVLFMANDGTHGWEIWVTDGTADGTQLFVDTTPGAAGSARTSLSGETDLFKLPNGKVIFSFDTAAFGLEPWVTNGTPNGTLLLADIKPGPAGSSPYENFVVRGEIDSPVKRLIIEAASDGTDFEPWVTDGTPAGTMLLADMYPGNRSYPQDAGPFGPTNHLILAAYTTPTLWITDGTPSGTQKVSTAFSSLNMTPISGTEEINGKFVFFGSTAANGTEFWITDGTVAGSTLLKDSVAGAGGLSSPAHLVTAPNNTFALYNATHNSFGREIWRTDGTVAGTFLLKDINPGIENSFILPPNFIWIPSKNGWLFTATSANEGTEIWFTDGTTTGTIRLADINSGPGSSVYTEHRFYQFPNQELWLFKATSAAGNELWVTDGTPVNTKSLGDFNPGSGDFDARAFFVFQNQYYFFGNNPDNTRDLWKSDGTTSGTVRLSNNNFTMEIGGSDDLSNSDYSQWGVLKNKFYFIGNDLNHGRELWMTDGTPAGTKLFADLNPGPDDTQLSRNGSLFGLLPSFSIHNEMLFFRARLPLTGFELFILYPE